jgi:hypothetical protein
MDTRERQPNSQLFTMRLWAEALGDGRTEWRGQVQHVISGETHYFREWPTLIAWVLAMLQNVESHPGADEHV